MKKIFFLLSLGLILSQQLFSKEITVCNSDSRMGKKLVCKGNYSGTTNLVALYRHGWRLITVVAGTDTQGSANSIYTELDFTYYLER